LKGHTIEVSALAVDCSTESLLISGSADTTVKLWDLRTKNSISYVKVHRKKVNAITSTSSRVLLTAGEDGFFSGYDLKMMRPVFLHEV
jgi:katanin p80 WD40 repeat-containing subunit B1